MLKTDLSIVHLLLSMAVGSIATFMVNAIFPVSLHAQVTPSDGAKLNYRVVGFSFPAKQAATQYVVEVASGDIHQDKEFTRRAHLKISAGSNRVVGEVPSFGADYTWRVVYKHNLAVLACSRLYHFKTGNLPPHAADSKRLRVKIPATRYADACILADGSNVMYDMNGKPIWYLPEKDSLTLDSDLKVSPSGTITFIRGGDAYEINYSGQVLWKSNNTGDPDNYSASGFVCHHEVNKLGNGHYMVLMASQHDKHGRSMPELDQKKFFPPLTRSTLAEFDSEGKIVWSWESAKYMQQSDLASFAERYPKTPFDLHENAFHFDEKDSLIYIGMAGVNRIVKIQYPAGKVVGEYGAKLAFCPLSPADSSRRGALRALRQFGNNLFRHQHALKRSDDGFLYTYNNNSSGNASLHPDGGNSSGEYPQVLKMKEAGDTLEKVWAFDCKAIIGDRKLTSGGGGNVNILPDNSLFVSMNTPYGDLFIVDHNKNILWNAILETYQTNQTTWVEYPGYRASIVTREQLEKLIWSSI